MKLLGDMQRRGVGPDELCTAMAMNTCVAAREPLRALDLFRDMRDVAGVSVFFFCVFTRRTFGSVDFCCYSIAIVFMAAYEDRLR